MWCDHEGNTWTQGNVLNNRTAGPFSAGHLSAEPLDYSQRDPRAFNPYTSNGGSVVAVAGENYAVIGADTRLSTGFNIFTRLQKKLFPLSERTVLGATECWCDTLTLTRLVKTHMTMYRLDNGRNLSTPSVAQMLSNMLYYRRFFPYFVSNILAGLDDEGKGCVFSFDAIGHFTQSGYYAGGSAGAQLQPLLDCQISQGHDQNAVHVPLPCEKAISLIKDVFIGAAERDVFTGDSIILMAITADGIKEEKFDLRKD